MKRLLLVFTFFLLLIAGANAQTVQGKKTPQLTTAERNLIQVSGNPYAEGQLIYNVDIRCLEYWDGTEWIPLCECEGGPCDPPDVIACGPVCAGGGTCTLSPATGGTWSSSNTAVATVGTATGVVTGVAAGTAMMTFTITATSCTNLISVAVTVNPKPTAPASLTASPPVVTEGSSTTLTAAAGIEGSSIYQWGTGSCGSATTISGTGSVVTVTPALGTTTYWVRRTGTGTCSSNTTTCASVVVTVTP